MRPRALPVLTVAIVAVMGGTAGAHHLPISTAWKVQQSLPIADAAWPDSPCTGRLQVRTNSTIDAELQAMDAQGRYSGDCVLDVRSDLEPSTFCITLVHEAGHAAGLGHSDTMAPSGQTYAPCDPLFQPLHLAAMAREAAAQRPGHAWTCRGDHQRQTCTGRPTPRARRWGCLILTRTPAGAIDEVSRYVRLRARCRNVVSRLGSSDGPGSGSRR